MEKVKEHPFSLRVILFLYMGGALLLAQFIYSLSQAWIESAMLGFMSPSPDAIVFKDGQYISFWNTQSMPSGGTEIINPSAFDTLNSLRSVSPVLIYGICILIATYLFYRLHTKPPPIYAHSRSGKDCSTGLGF